jgi:hypothetical protein
MRMALALSINVACTPVPDKPPSGTAGSATRAVALQRTLAEEPSRSCGAVGPVACEVAPSAVSDICSRQAACVIARVEGGKLLNGMQVACERAPTGSAQTLARREPAPGGSGVIGTAALDMIAGPEMMAAFGGSYLVAELPEGYCLVDVALDWTQRHGSFETDFRTRWEAHDGRFRFHVDAHRVMHEPLDREDQESTSDGSGEHCVRSVYEVSGGRFTRVRRESQRGPCAAAPSGAAAP